MQIEFTEEYYESQYQALSESLEAEKDRDTDNSLEKYKNLQKEFSGNWIELYQQLDTAHKNAFWKRIIKDISIDKDTHKISGFSFV